jgi:hypothetical protein
MSVTATRPEAGRGDEPTSPRRKAQRDRLLALATLLRERHTRFVLVIARRRRTTAAIVGTLWALVALARMLWPGPVGLADAGDGQRVMCQAGATSPDPTMGSSGGYLELWWPAHRFYGEACGVPTTGETYRSSQLVLLRFASWLGSLAGLAPGIDLRVLAVLCSLLVGLGVGLLVLALPPSLSWPKRVVLASIVGLIMLDSGIARFYASPYTEAAAVLGLLLLCPALLWLLRQRRYTWGAMLAVAGAGTFALLAKTQMVSILPALVVVLLLRPSLPEHLRAGSRLARSTMRRSWLRRWLWVRLPALVLIAAIAAIAVGTLKSQPKRYAEINAYSQVFTTMLPLSPNPESDLRWFGLDPTLARGAGTNIYSPDTVAYDPAYADFVDAVTPGKVVMFYLSQPGRLVKLADAGMAGMAGYGTEAYMANYPESAGEPPFARESRIAVVSWVLSAYRAVPWLFALQWLVVLVVCVRLVRRWRGARPGRSAVARLGLFLLGALSVQFWAIMMTEGNNEIFKHMIPVDLMMFLTVPVLLACWLQRMPRSMSPVQDDDPET